MTGAHTKPIESNLQVAVIHSNTIECTKVRLENHQQTLAQIVEGIDSLKEEPTTTIVKLLQHLSTDHYFRQHAQRVDTMISEYTIDKIGLVFRVAPINGAAQVLMPQARLCYLLYHSHHPAMAGLFGQGRLYDFMRRKFF